MWKEVSRRCSAKTPSCKFHKIYRELPVLESSFWRSSLLEVFCKKEVLENFVKFTRKHLCQSLIFKRDSGTGASCEFSENSQNTFSYRSPPPPTSQPPPSPRVASPRVAASACNTVKCVQAVKLATLWKRDHRHTRLSEPVVCRSSTK